MLVSEEIEDIEEIEKKKYVGHGRGERNGRAVLTENQVRAIRKERKIYKTSYPKIAKKYGVAHRTIGAICRRTSWDFLE